MPTAPHKQPNLEDLLFAFRRNIVDACRKEGMQYELTFSQVEILRFIGESGKETMKSIADHLKITPPSATAMIDEMEKRGLVKRINDTQDRRVVIIAFTPKAKKLFASISARKQTILSSMLSRLSTQDKKTLERIITILITP